MSKKILIIGSSGAGFAAAMKVAKEKYGEDAEIYTTQQAEELGLKPEDFANISSYKIEAPPELPNYVLEQPKCGRSKRREGRKKKFKRYK
jgi:hypothetical protein